MKVILCTAAVCLVIGASVFTTQKVVQAEARKTRNSMPGVLNNPLEGGESLVARVDKLNATLAAINKRLTRLEDLTSQENKVDNSEIKEISTGIRQELDRLSLRVNNMAKDQEELNGLPSQLKIMDLNMRTAINAIDNRTPQENAPSEEVIKIMEWMVDKIEDIDSYFPPLYDFLGAVYDTDATTADYPSVDLRLNEVIQILDKVQQDAAATRQLVTPYVIEPKKRPRPFDTEQ